MKMDLSKIVKADLSEYITPKTFRTIDRDLMDDPWAKTKTEIKVIIDVSESLDKNLSFVVPKRKQIFGFAKVTGTKLEELSNISRLTIEPIESLYFMTLEYSGFQRNEIMEVRESDIVFILENCLRIPELCKLK